MANNVTLVGRITKDLELKKTPGQNPVSVCSFTLAVNRTFTSQGGEKADFIRCVAWRMTAENLAKFQGKGSLISVVGRIQVTSKEINGKREYFTEVVAENIQFLESKKNQESRDQQQGSQQNNYNNQQQGSQQGNYGNQQGGYNNNNGDGYQQQGGQQGNYGNQQGNNGGQQQGGYGNTNSYVPAGPTNDDDLPPF